MWTRKDYEREALKIAKEFAVSNGEQSINKIATEVARNNNLDPEGIRILVRLTNVDAVNEHFSKAAGDDRIIEFETGDPEVVIQELHNEAEEKIASVSLPQEYSQLNDYWLDEPKEVVKSETEKVAEAEPEKIPKRHEVVLLLKRAEEEFDMGVRRTEISWAGTMEECAQSTRMLGHMKMAEALEKDALALVGTQILPELHMLAKLTGREFNMTTEKTAEILDKHLAVPSDKHRPIIQMLEKASVARAKRNENKKCLEFVREKLSSLS
jgi:hypothetical protein